MAKLDGELEILVISIREGRNRRACALLKDYPELASMEKWGHTPLWHAIVHNQEMVLALLEVDPSLASKPDNWGQYPLHAILESFNLSHKPEIVQALLAADASVASLPYKDKNGWGRCDYDLYPGGKVPRGSVAFDRGRLGIYPLHMAAEIGQLEEVQALLAVDASVASLPCKDGRCPLHLAASRGDLEVVQALLAVDRSVASKPDNKGESPLHWAAEKGNLEVVLALLAVDSSVASTPSRDGQYPLHRAAMHGHLEVFQALLAVDRSVASKPDNKGKTPLHWAAEKGNLEVVQALLAVDRSVASKSDDIFHRSPLHYAAQKGNLGAVQALLAVDPSLASQPDEYGKTPLHLAAEEGHLEVMQALLAVDPSLVSKPDNIGHNPLYNAVYKGNHKAVQALLAVDSSLASQPSERGSYPLDQCAHAAKTVEKVLDVIRMLKLFSMYSVYPNEKNLEFIIRQCRHDGRAFKEEDLVAFPKIETIHAWMQQLNKLILSNYGRSDIDKEATINSINETNTQLRDALDILAAEIGEDVFSDLEASYDVIQSQLVLLTNDLESALEIAAGVEVSVVNSELTSLFRDLGSSLMNKAADATTPATKLPLYHQAYRIFKMAGEGEDFLRIRYRQPVTEPADFSKAMQDIIKDLPPELKQTIAQVSDELKSIIDTEKSAESSAALFQPKEEQITLQQAGRLLHHLMESGKEFLAEKIESKIDQYTARAAAEDLYVQRHSKS